MNLLFTFDPHMHCIILHVVLKPESAWWVDSRLELGRVKKKQGKKIRYDPATRSKTWLQPVDFFFLLKRHRFDFLKKKN